MSDVKTTEGGKSAPESTIAMLRDAVRILRRHQRDSEATALVNRIHGFLANFPTHFVVEFLEKTPTGALLHRVPLSDWPDWSDTLARRLDLVDLPATPVVELEHQAFGTDAAPAVRRPIDRRATGEVCRPVACDGLTTDTVPSTADVPDEELREQLAACREDWARVQLALGSHHHMDPEAVVAAIRELQEPRE